MDGSQSDEQSGPKAIPSRHQGYGVVQESLSFVATTSGRQLWTDL